MSKRNFPNWIEAFRDYASFGEAPSKMYSWVGAGTIAGALRRKVWIDQYYFKWYPNLYVVLVAPPGVIAKSTTMDIGFDLLKEVPGIQFGPSVVTWPALVQAFAGAAEGFDYKGEIHTMSPLTIASSEFGNLLNPQDKEMVDMLVHLWDGKSFKKLTKHSGSDDVVNPWINLIACTTPDWIAGNFPEYMIGGGFTSRCIFVYAEAKAKFVAYPGLSVRTDQNDVKRALIQDLEHISINLCGEYKLSREAIEWGQAWYEKHNKNRPVHLDDSRFGGYIARKQTHIHKTAMIFAAAQHDEMVIRQADLMMAEAAVTELEHEMVKVFAKIGMTEMAAATQRLLEFIKRRGTVAYEEAYRYIHSQFPSLREFEDILKGLISAGYIELHQSGSQYSLVWRSTSPIPGSQTSTTEPPPPGP